MLKEAIVRIVTIAKRTGIILFISVFIKITPVGSFCTTDRSITQKVTNVKFSDVKNVIFILNFQFIAIKTALFIVYFVV